MGDSSILPTYLLSRFTRERVTVALGGDGGDELFAGYDPFKALGSRSGINGLSPAGCTAHCARWPRCCRCRSAT